MYAPGRQGDVIVQIVTAPRHRSDPPAADLQIYDALVYSQLTLPVAPPATNRTYPAVQRSLPLRGVERITIDRTKYANWLAFFIEGEKSMGVMRDRMLEALSPGLVEILTKASVSVTVWWSTATPELDEFPWELTVDAGRRQGAHRVAFLRGLPPETPFPTVPLKDQPRLGLVGAKYLWPEWAKALTGEIGPTVTVFDAPLRQALRQATEAGVEFLHVFADGIASSALEGILYDHATATDPELPARELSTLLTGSRVVVLALSHVDHDNPDVLPMAGRSVLSAYRAFTYIGGSTVPLPTILAPLGPVPKDMMQTFWRAFYSGLTSSWNLTETLRGAQSRFPFSVPIALFCRHAGGKLFEQAGDVDVKPLEIRAELLQSQDITNNLSRLQKKYGQELPQSVVDLFEKESSRQSELRGTLDRWIPSGEDL
jgi:hypothetical protein